MRFLKFLISKKFLINFSIAIIFGVLSFWLTFVFIGKYTGHSDIVKVPYLIELMPDEANEILAKHNIKVEIIDSVYQSGVKKGSIVEQTPDSAYTIKENRTIFVVINAIGEEKVKMPDLKKSSLRQAIADAEIFGLKIGEKKYVPYFAKNYVLNQFYNGKEIMPGEIIPKGSYIDLEIGQGESNELTLVPNLKGLNLENANIRVNEYFLNIESSTYDESVETKEDSLNAIIFKQLPASGENNKISIGSLIDVWLTVKENIINKLDTAKTPIRNTDNYNSNEENNL